MGYYIIFGNPQEDAFDQVVKIIAETKEKIMGTDEERKERERINEEVFQRNISRRLKDASLWFQFHLSFDKKKDFSELERLTEKEKLKTLKFWKYWLFKSLEGLEKDKRDYLKKIDQLQRESLVARDEEYISQVCFKLLMMKLK